jgi:hypothetical protein
MRLETLDDALSRADAIRKPIRADVEHFRSASRQCASFHDRCLQSPRDEERDAFLQNAARLFDTRAAHVIREAELRAADDLERTFRYIRSEWKVAMPGCGVFAASFFVRSYRIEDGKPVAYDPFWIESCVLRAEDHESLIALHATWASGGKLRPDGSGPSDPLFPVRAPFGPVEDAARAPCAACGKSGYVIGHKEFVHWTEDSDVTYRQSLKLLCLECPCIVTLAERSDERPIKLHP